jgi:antitoxin component of MazEF toxin-antitoxin module
MEIRKIQKDGNSLVVPLPPKYLTAANLNTGDRVTITLTVEKEILISKLNHKPNGATQ